MNETMGQEREPRGWLAIARKLEAYAQDATGADTGADTGTRTAASGELVMPTNLDANQRRKCHQLADELGLEHESRGEGESRQIVIWRGPKAKAAAAAAAATSPEARQPARRPSLPAWVNDMQQPGTDAQPAPAAAAAAAAAAAVAVAPQLYAVQLQLPWPRNQAMPSARALRSLGPCEDLAPHLTATAMTHNIPAEVLTADLSPELVAECAPRDLTEVELSSRRDFRAESVFSIDPAGAKDLDDALHIKPCESGDGYEVGIHIADLSTFVKPGSALDDYAGARGTTTYLPNSNLPMVPRQLSENLCSLRGGEDRRTFSVPTPGECIYNPDPLMWLTWTH